MPRRRQYKANISVRNFISQCSFNSHHSHKLMGFQISPDLLNLVRCHYLFQFYFIFAEIMFQMSSNRSCHQALNLSSSLSASSYPHDAARPAFVHVHPLRPKQK